MKRGMIGIGFRNRNKTSITPHQPLQQITPNSLQSPIDLTDQDDEQPTTTEVEPKVWYCDFPGCAFSCTVRTTYYKHYYKVHERGPEASGFSINANNVFVSIGSSSSSDTAAATFPWPAQHGEVVRLLVHTHITNQCNR